MRRTEKRKEGRSEQEQVHDLEETNSNLHQEFKTSNGQEH